VSFRLPGGRIVSGHVIVDWAADSRMPGLGVMMYRKLAKFFCHRASRIRTRFSRALGFVMSGTLRSTPPGCVHGWNFGHEPVPGDPFCACCASERSHELHFPHDCHDCESTFNPRLFLYDNHPGLAAGRTLGES
jgi:hypothetical protein